MGLSNFEWVIVHSDGSTDVVISDCIEEVVMEHCTEEQPIAIIRGKLY